MNVEGQVTEPPPEELLDEEAELLVTVLEEPPLEEPPLEAPPLDTPAEVLEGPLLEVLVGPLVELPEEPGLEVLDNPPEELVEVTRPELCPEVALVVLVDRLAPPPPSAVPPGCELHANGSSESPMAPRTTRPIRGELLSPTRHFEWYRTTNSSGRGTPPRRVGRRRFPRQVVAVADEIPSRSSSYCGRRLERSALPGILWVRRRRIPPRSHE